MTVAPATSMTFVLGPAVARHLRARAARDDATVVDRERFDDAEVRVDGQDLAVRDDGVDVLLRERRDDRECGEDADDGRQACELRLHCLFTLCAGTIPGVFSWIV